MLLRPASDDPSDYTPEQRLREVAAILAEAARRLRHQAIRSAPTGEVSPESASNSDLHGQISTESSSNGLELSPRSRPDRPGG